MFKKGTQAVLKQISRTQDLIYKEDDLHGKLENRDILIKYERTGKYTKVFTQVIPKVSKFQKLECSLDGWPEESLSLILRTLVKYNNHLADIKHDALLARIAKEEIINRFNNKRK